MTLCKDSDLLIPNEAIYIRFKTIENFFIVYLSKYTIHTSDIN